ncbi:MULTISPECIES: M23 family metallopeptidase [Pseudomonas]|uniref:Peptidoglycan DD-metalloendopeptidase family protein n=1 Tax=Pseudomonas qingdaonensis TaxID=2056231 RepID=A0ABX8DUN4_9PSED|nr:MULTISPECIES: M23 family metallopeptidase [Pseudomonas]MBG8562297.1 peptidoglycan DD-metalloendopeptidase family protein [Pseudomonas qingdaonensis]MCO7505278.1 peptidoglycan DD-metalloendopeptidase family protein [Pseudomonas sp. VE 267-6A]MCO7528854.1 peptidoglycan DD-metalloendopeptidase family protein [Pseudomonas sp. 2]OUM29858.1 peptidase M23 [Pseudomonas sp. 1239]QVL20021.1 peptidoglycan DD-metalloendopeptidase family protein [Pseudomonas qingdaonensis]
MPRLFAPLLVLCLAFAGSAQASYITRQLNKPVPGGVAVVDLGPAAQAPQARFDGKPVLVVREQDTWLAIVGLPLTQKPGTASLTQGERTLSFTVASKKYPEQRITLKNQRQVNPNPADLKRIDAELAEQIKAYRSFSPNLPSNLLLDKPVNGPLSSKFGVRRFFNGEERNPHAGLDFAVPAGTPIKTPANGKVILIGNYFFNGNTVFVDHGQGFISMFCHMSKIDVKPGQQLSRGAIVGRVGSTGRATGPHMHWNVSLNDARVDPAIFIGAFQP